jgi:hypothetical protein
VSDEGLWAHVSIELAIDVVDAVCTGTFEGRAAHGPCGWRGELRRAAREPGGFVPSNVPLPETYAAKGLTIVGMYHHKSETPMKVDEVRSLTQEHYRFRFPVAIDAEWKTLKRWWLERARRQLDERELPPRPARRRAFRAPRR